MIGQTLGHYRIVEKIGAGGMGEVYRAEDLVLGRKAAIKVLRSETLTDEVSRARFLRDARIIGGLNHPNIAVLYEAGESSGLQFIAMEFIEGITLRAEICDGPLTEARVIQYATELAAALAHAHGHGILHRDIKSANAMVTPENSLKLLDFGLAESLCGERRNPLHGHRARHLARNRAVQRARSFLRPARGRAQRSLQPRRGDVQRNGLRRIALRRPRFHILDPRHPARRRTPGAPAQPRTIASLAQLIEQAMAARADDRFRTADELLSALRALADGSAVKKAAGSLPVLAILEFENLSKDPAFDWLGTGIAETIQADLKKLNPFA